MTAQTASRWTDLRYPLYDQPASKEVVPEKHLATRKNRPDSAVLSCPNICASGPAIGKTAQDQVLAQVFGQDGQKGNLRRTTVAGVFHILSTPLKNGVKPKSRNRSMTMQSKSLVLDTITVRQHNGLFCLNDLHKAAGNEKRHQPSDFLKIDQTQALISEIENSEDSRSLQVNTGRNGGTYACKELVIAYAAWISAAFHLKVIRVFLAAQAQSAANPAIEYDRISPAQAQDLKEIVQAIVKAGVQGYGETWNRFQRKFRVNSYLELPAARYEDAVAYLSGKLDTPATPDRIRINPHQLIEHAADMAGQVFAQALKQAATQGSPIDRFVIEADYATRKVDMRIIKRDAYIMNDAEWLDHFKARVTHAIAA